VFHKEVTLGLREYFEGLKGYGVLATADEDGNVDVAIYATPYVADENTVAFIMADRLTRRNLLSNPHAAYLFKEPGERFSGKRLFLSMQRELREDEVTDPVLSDKYKKACGDYPGETLSVIYFKVDKTLPLVGEGE
jgi:hypothetical protein